MYGKSLVAVLTIVNAGFIGIALAPNIHQSESTLVMLHMIACAGNTYLLAILLRTLIPAAFITIAAGVFVEAAQTLVPGRSASINDLIIDGLGIALGTLIYMSVQKTSDCQRAIIGTRY